MDSSPTHIDDSEPFFHLSSSSINPPRSSSHVDLLTDDSLPDYHFQQQPRRQNTSDQRSNNGRRHRSSGSPVYLTGELYPTRNERDVESSEDLIVSAVEQTIKKYADNILKYLEGMSGRLSQLESVTHVLEHSIASLKTSVDEYHAEADVKTRLLNENIREMHRGVQILRDRQDIIETQAELAKLQASKADILVEKNKVAASVTIETPVSSHPVLEEKQSSALISKNMQVISSNQSNVPLSQRSETTGQIQNVTLSSDSNTVPQQQYLSAQSQIQHSQQPHGQLQLVPAQSQQSHGLQAVPVHGTVQQSQSSNQNSITLQQPEPLQSQVMSQHLQMQQTAGGQSQLMPQNSSQAPNIQYISTSTASPAQTTFQTHQLHQGLSAVPQQVPTQNISQPQQIHATVNPQLQAQYLSQSIPTANQMFLPAQHNPTVQPQGIPASSMQVGYGARAYNSANTVSYQQQKPMDHLPQSPQPHSNQYQRNPKQISGPQPVYADQPAGANTHLLPVAQTVYSDAGSGGRSDAFSWQDSFVENIGKMGYPREQVRSVIRELLERGQPVNLNSILDMLMNGEKQPRRAWPR